MGSVYTTNITISNPGDPKQTKTKHVLVDTGTGYSIIARADLEALGIMPRYKKTFRLTNKAPIERDIGTVTFIWNGDRMATVDCVFGETDDYELLGVIVLGLLGLKPNPLTGQVEPTDLLILNGE